jgi:hypothetical protein
MIYLVSGGLVYSLLLGVHYCFAGTERAPAYVAVHFAGFAISLALILTGKV